MENRNPPATKTEIQRAVNLKACGHSVSETARILKRALPTVQGWLVKAKAEGAKVSRSLIAVVTCPYLTGCLMG